MKVLYTHSGTEAAPVLCPAPLLAKELQAAGIGVKIVAPSFTENLLDSSWKRLRRYRSPETYDIYHAHSIERWCLSTCHEHALHAHKPYMISLNGMLHPRRIEHLSFIEQIKYQLCIRRRLRNAACVHVTSETELHQFRQMGYTNPVCLIPHAVEIKKYPETHTDKTFRIGFLGYLHPEKHIERLFYSLHSLLRLVPNTPVDRPIELIVIGEHEGAYMLALKNEVKRLGIAKHVKFKGNLQGEKKDQALSTCSVVVMPNAHENSSQRLLEALVRNIPCIGTKGSPSHNLDTNCCGWTIDPTQESLNKALLEAYHTPNRYLKVMGQNGRNLVEKEYSIQAVANQLKNVYNWLLGGEKPLGIVW